MQRRNWSPGGAELASMVGVGFAHETHRIEKYLEQLREKSNQSVSAG